MPGSRFMHEFSARSLVRLLLLSGLVLVMGLGLRLSQAEQAARIDFDVMRGAMQERYGSQGVEAVNAWESLLRELDGRPVREQLRDVNRFFNERIRFGEDQDVWGKPDYWATPLESLGEGRGDCEDYSIAKYVSLRILGVPNEQLRLIYVRARIGGRYSSVSQAHMVLGYYPTSDAEPLILDNLVGEVRPSAERDDLQPVFSFNSDGLWTPGARSSQADPTARISRWGNVLQRLEQEGFRQ
ncbi:transglutaminase-like cysteine peptidase [Methylonatrum kenyense]|uniref:transglutaminase-like cysteine peptidase n=1 Tax=Methylonatrum kenyense TaxID=455253 RepID=UPI0020BFE408|nr:transglutaminase-like cysteine peptidase [Methylonatrum kenyense]MCK8515471.1 transglutaminase-like cysteine peptidase [Methylonatrum kenyense]